jgi:hypothetical protein
MSRRKKRKNAEIPVVNVIVSHDVLPCTILGLSVTVYPALGCIQKKLQDRGIRRVMCLGIGDPCRSGAARLQLAFILKLSGQLNISNLVFYDPICCPQCVVTLGKMGIECQTEDCEGRFEFDRTTLFFMPHCPRFLYHNLLVENWTSEKMADLLLIGNSFSYYSDECRLFLQPKRSSVEDLFDAGVVTENVLDFNGSDTFSTTSLMEANAAGLTTIDAQFFISRPEFMHATAPS